MFYCRCLMADTVPTCGGAHVTRADTNLTDPKFNETFYLLSSESELASKVIKVHVCSVSANAEPQSLVRDYPQQSGQTCDPSILSTEILHLFLGNRWPEKVCQMH